MIKKFQQFGSDVKYEMSKVSWPDWNDLKGSTYVVLVFSLILTFYLFVVDFFLQHDIAKVAKRNFKEKTCFPIFFNLWLLCCWDNLLIVCCITFVRFRGRKSNETSNEICLKI